MSTATTLLPSADDEYPALTRRASGAIGGTIAYACEPPCGLHERFGDNPGVAEAHDDLTFFRPCGQLGHCEPSLPGANSTGADRQSLPSSVPSASRCCPRK